jgi:gliding motility-associated-like protein
MKRIQLLIVLLISNLAISQLSNKHWLPPLHANEDQAADLILDHYLYLSTPETTPFDVTVKDGAGTLIGIYTISQGNPIRVFVGSEQPSVMFLDKADVGTVQSGKGLILEAPLDFFASFRVRAGNHAEFLSSKGITGAGKTFRLGSLPQSDSGSIRNFISSFMATEDNTTVNLSDYDPNIQFIIGNSTQAVTSQNFILNKGQSVVVSGNTDDAFENLSGFVGALLTSDKPIVVNTGNLAGGLSPADQGQDFILDQIVPLEQVGQEYVIVKASENDNSEFPLVIAHTDNTEIFVNGNSTPIATLNAGEYFLIPPSNYIGNTGNRNMYISSNNRIFLYQIISGSDTSNATSGFYFIPPLSCFWQKSVDLIPSINSIGGVTYNGNIVIATESGSVVSINNVPTTALPIPVQGNPNWVSYKITGVAGNVKVESTGALAVGVYGFSGFAGYGGYFSGFGNVPNDSSTIVCTGNSVDLFDRIPGNPEPGGTWSYNNITRVPDNGIFDPAVDPIGIYTYTFSKTCDGITRNFPILIDVSTQQGPNVGMSSSKSFCINDTTVDMFTLLGTGITTGGTWTFNGTLRPNSILNPSTDLSGEYKYTIPANNVCQEASSIITITINNTPNNEVLQPYIVCDDAIDGDTNGITLFTLTNKTSEIIGTQTGISVKYYIIENDAIINNTNNITSIRTSSNTRIYTRITNSQGCSIINSFELIVSPLPVTLNEVSLKQCDDDTDANTYFNLTDANQIITNDTGLSFTYHNTQSGATNDNDLVANELNHYASNGSVIWARIETNQGCFRVTKVNLVVSTTQIPASFNPATLEECDDYVDASNLANDGYDNFDIETAFTQLIKDVFPVGQRPFLVVTYYQSFNDALLISNPITNPTNFRNTVPNDQPIWARVDSRLNTDSGCKGIKELQLKVNPLPEFELGDDFVLCVDPNTGIGLEVIDATPTVSGSYNYTWTPTNPNLDAFGNESPLYDITQGGTYSVVVTNTVTGCQNFDNITATFSSEPATFTASVVTPAFSSGLTTIECLATGGYGIYEYSLNLVDWQSSPIFTDLPNGTYTAYVRDLQGCDMLSVGNLFAVTYPNFFTPNGDGYHDTWNIFGLDDSFAANIYIYDRFGKLLKQISPNGEGWNGTFNGQILPSTDYWFRIEYTENNVRKEFKSHFSLIR